MRALSRIQVQGARHKLRTCAANNTTSRHSPRSNQPTTTQPIECQSHTAQHVSTRDKTTTASDTRHATSSTRHGCSPLTVSLKTHGVGRKKPTPQQQHSEVVREEGLSQHACTQLSHGKRCEVKQTGIVRTTRRCHNNTKRCAHCCAHLHTQHSTHALTPLPDPAHTHTRKPQTLSASPPPCK
jgi:hypothetical protein